LGRPVQKRLLRKLDVEMFLSTVQPHPSPRPDLEQYTIPVDVAATMLYIAAYTYGDIAGKKVLDLGCGTGRLALGAAFLGAEEVVGVDLDKTAVMVARENAKTTRLKARTQWVAGEIDAVHGTFDTVLQNPPFGVQKRQADREFLEKALEAAKAVYSLHKRPQEKKRSIGELRSARARLASTHASSFLEEFIAGRGGRVKAVYPLLMTVPHMFDFHTKRKHEFAVDLYVIEKR
jgi:putative methylase